jgi:hypothetical protein
MSVLCSGTDFIASKRGRAFEGLRMWVCVGHRCAGISTSMSSSALFGSQGMEMGTPHGWGIFEHLELAFRKVYCL